MGSAGLSQRTQTRARPRASAGQATTVPTLHGFVCGLTSASKADSPGAGRATSLVAKILKSVSVATADPLRPVTWHSPPGARRCHPAGPRACHEWHCVPAIPSPSLARCTGLSRNGASTTPSRLRGLPPTGSVRPPAETTGTCRLLGGADEKCVYRCFNVRAVG